MGSIHLGSKKKTTTTTTATSTPLDQYAPYITKGLESAQSVFDTQQPRLQQLGGAANDVYSSYKAPNAALANIYNGTNPAQATYAGLQNAQANDPSMGLLSKFAQGSANPATSALQGYASGGANDPSMSVLQKLAQGSTSPGQYDGIGSNNPALSMLQGMTNQQVNGDSKQFYQDTLNGKYLNNNPYIDSIAQQGTDAATKAANARFAASGMGDGMSTPYAQALGSSVADANNQLRYGAYNNELNRMGQIGGQSDSMYNATQDRSLSAASQLGTQYNQSGALQLSAQQAKDAAFNADRGAQLAAGQSLGSQYMAGQNLGLNAATALGSQYLTGQGQQQAAAQAMGNQYNANNQTALNGANGSINSTLSALGMQPNMANGQLNALGASATLPFAGTQAYSGLVNGLTAKYGTNTGNGTTTEKNTPGLFDWMQMWGNNAAKAAGGGA